LISIKEAGSYGKGYCPSYIRLRVVRPITIDCIAIVRIPRFRLEGQANFHVLRLLEYHYRVLHSVALIP
jgi:hypothetical protein